MHKHYSLAFVRLKWKSFTDFPWFIGSQSPSGRILRAFIGCSGSKLHRISIESTRLRENRPHFPIPEFGLTVSFDVVSWPLSNEITLWERLKLYETCCFVIRIRHVVVQCFSPSNWINFQKFQKTTVIMSKIIIEIHIFLLTLILLSVIIEYYKQIIIMI